jgi:multidrug transporter EmrE-like cation transporter
VVKANLLAWVVMLSSGVCAGIGNLLVKRSRLQPADNGLANLAFSPWFALAIVFFLANVFLLAKALESLPVSMAGPAVSGTNFVVVVLGAALVFGESLSLIQYLGLASIVLGIVLVGRT